MHTMRFRLVDTHVQSGQRGLVSRVSTLFLFLHLLFALCEGKWSCISTEDSTQKGLRTVLAPKLNQDWCEDLDETKEVDQLMDMCQGWCGQNNIPFLVGIPTHGFNLQDMDKICVHTADTAASPDSPVLRYDPDLMSNCKRWSRSLNLIQMRAAEFVAALDNMTYAQMVFRQGMATQIQKIVDEIGSDETKLTMKNVEKDSQLLATYMNIVQTHLQEFLSGGKLRGELQGTMKTLSNAGESLNRTLTTNLPDMRDYFEKCGVPLLATTSSNEYLMDLCNVRSPNCLAPDDVDAKHVGCCCGAVPISGSLGISGESAGRRLEEEDESEDESEDVCGEAAHIFKKDKDALEKTLQQDVEGQELLTNYKSALKKSYPDYYKAHVTECEGGRRLEGTVQEESRAQAESALPNDGAPTAGLRRLLKKLTSCDPQRSIMKDEETLRVAFWKDTETDYCSSISTTSGLVDTCQAFCGANAVPLMIGGTSFGFNQSAMDSVCGGSGEPISTDSGMVAECHKDARGLNDVRAKAATFISKLEILNAEKLRYEASVKATVQTMKESIKSKAKSVISDAEVGKKIDALRNLLKQETSTLTSRSAGAKLFRLNTATTAVQDTGDELSSELVKNLQGVEDLVEHCSRLFTGVGSDQEYLLDLCSQTSTQCIESPTGRHAGCCCGYLPLLTLGLSTMPVHTIPGLSNPKLGDSTSGKRVAARLRRMQAATDEAFHICAESSKLAKSAVQKSEEEVKNMGYENILVGAKAVKVAKYPEYYCQPKSVCVVETGGTCSFFGCDSSRGDTECKDGRCLCSAGHCVHGGKCVQQDEASSAFGPLPSFLGFVVSAFSLLTGRGSL